MLAKQKKDGFHQETIFLCWRKPIFPGRLQPSIFGTSGLNFRVRDGNGWTPVVINTNYSFHLPGCYPRLLRYNTTVCRKMQAFFQIFSIPFLFLQYTGNFWKFNPYILTSNGSGQGFRKAVPKGGIKVFAVPWWGLGQSPKDLGRRSEGKGVPHPVRRPSKRPSEAAGAPP